MALGINKAGLERICKEIIETILLCLPNAYKGTVYRVGKPPGLVVKHVTSGIMDDERKTISWGLPEESEYNPPGKAWLDYRDEPGRPLEAMAWCVEKQKSWTSEDPENDPRNVRHQIEGRGGDFSHMEPVLMRKADLHLDNGQAWQYPENIKGETIWQDSEYVVMDVIKIHFRPNTIGIDSPETRTINKLSRVLGTEILSNQLKLQSIEAMRKLACDRLNTSNILADSLRNAITKTGLIFSLIKLELGFLRDQWEVTLLRDADQKNTKYDIIGMLNKAAQDMGGISDESAENMIDIHNRFLDLSMPPERGENWVYMQIEERWEDLFRSGGVDKEKAGEIRNTIDKLKRSLYLGKDPEILAQYNNIPESLMIEWVDLIYRSTDHINPEFLERVINILEHRDLRLPYQAKSRKSLIRLKALAEIIGQLEKDTNVVLREVLNGYDKNVISKVLMKKTYKTP